MLLSAVAKMARGKKGDKKGVLDSSSPDDDDLVYPLHALDTTDGLKRLSCEWLYRFDNVLDADKLNDALTRLLSMGHWKKAGGRLRTRVGPRRSNRPTMGCSMLTLSE